MKSYAILAIIAWGLNTIQKGKEKDILKPCYLILAVAGVTFYVANHFKGFSDSQGIRLYAFFFLGSCAYVWRKHIVFSGLTALVIAIFLVLATLYLKSGVVPIYAVGMPYLILYLAYIPKGVIRQFNKLGDYSYGIYIYAFPIQQSVLYLNPNLSFGMYIAYSALGTLAMAIFSWHVVEKRCLKFRRHGRNREKPA